MDSERERQITNIFHSALAREAGERSAYLDRACAGNDDLRREVEMLIESHEQAGSFIDAPAYERGAELLDDQPSAGSLAGRRFGQYRLVSLIGAGGMGEVYLAEDTRLDRRVAIKVLPADLIADQAQVGRFQQEARAASALNHPNIITVYDVNESDGTQYIATEYIEGATLRARLGCGALTIQDTLDIAVQVAGALSAAHGAGVVHRDIKPENVMLRPDGYVKVLDFGIAKLTEKWRSFVEDEAPARALVQTGKGVVMGTAHYMSPEQARGSLVDARTDIWSLGVVLYEMVSGQLPFEGETVSDCIASILKTDPPTLSEFAPEFPVRLDWIVQKALRKDADERYQTAKEMLSDLRAVRKEADALEQRERSAPAKLTSRDGATSGSGAEGEGVVATGDSAVAATGTSKRTTSSAEYIVTEITRHKWAVVLALFGRSRKLAYPATLMALLGLGVLGYCLSLKNNKRNSTAKGWANPIQSIDVRQLTAIGKIEVAALSPDGKYFAYALGQTDQPSLWFGHVSGNQRVELRPPDRTAYSGLTFTPDGNQIYYVVNDATNPRGALYRIPVMGGAHQKVLDEINGAVTFSPDGRQLAFVRGDAQRKVSALVIASAENGADKRELATRPIEQGFVVHGPSWSPDGGLIAVGGIQEDRVENDEILIVRVNDGRTEKLGSHRWAGVRRVAWLRDRSGLFVNVIEKADFGDRHIWLLDYPGGELHKITSDPVQYAAQSLSISDDGQSLLAVRAQALVNIWSGPGEDPSQSRPLTSNSLGKSDGGQGLAIAADGRIVYSSNFDKSETLWVMNADGGGARQLTPRGFLDREPSLTRDGRYVVFNSTRSGDWNIWRVGRDGSDLRQLTTSGGLNPSVTMDSQWILYEAKDTIWRISIDGGKPVRLLSGQANWPSVSPDGVTFACRYRASDGKRVGLAVFPITGGDPLHVFDTPPANAFGAGLRWLPDGSAILYRAAFGHSLWRQALKGGPPRKVFDQPDQIIYAFDASTTRLVSALGTRARDVVLMHYGR